MYRRNVSVDIQINKYIYIDRTWVKTILGTTWGLCPQVVKIPMDLHMEHLNRELKEGMRHLASNTSEASIIRIGKCLQKLIDF